MIFTDMSSLFSDEVDKIVFGIKEAIFTINQYVNTVFRTKEMLFELREDITIICDFWSGKTYVGSPKNTKVKAAFQEFFEDLMQLLIVLKHNGNNDEQRFANSMLYRGTIYRYLGNCSPSKKRIKPKYESIYVSWSKSPENRYLLSKLYGPVTWMSCEIKEPLYGIDLQAIGCSRANEQEVVFPTIKQCITEIKYISEGNDE